MQKHFLADWFRLKIKRATRTSPFFTNGFASSECLNMVLSTENCREHEPSFGPRVHPQPSWRNFLSLLANSSPFSLSPCCSAIMFRKTAFFFRCRSILMILLSWKCASTEQMNWDLGAFVYITESTWLFLLGNRVQFSFVQYKYFDSACLIRRINKYYKHELPRPISKEAFRLCP